MKKLILSALACIALVISSCNQNSPAPAPATPATAPTPTPTSTMTVTEALLVGDWIFDKVEQYSSGNLVSVITTSTKTMLGTTTTYTAYAGTHMVLKSSLYSNAAGTTPYFNADYYGIPAFSAYWYILPSTYGDRFIGPPFQPFSAGVADPIIITLNATTLIYQSWIPGQIVSGNKIYCHK